MRCSAWSSLAISACSAVALALAAPAGAHVEVTPAFVTEGATETLSVVGHNDRTVPLTEFEVAVPAGFEIEEAAPVAGWEAAADGTTATWTGGQVAPDREVTFSLVAEAPARPGVVEIVATKRYSDGAVVAAPAALTVLPGEESSSPAYLWAVAGTAGLLALAGLLLAWRRRGSVRR